MSENKSLNSIIEEGKALMTVLTDNGGEIDDSLEKALDEVQKTFASKADAYGYVVRKLAAEVEFANLHKNEFAAYEKRLKTNLEYLKSRIKLAMVELNYSKIGPFTISACKPSLEIDENDIPIEFVKTEIIKSPDKTLIRETLEGGNKLEFARLVPGTALRTGIPLKQ